MCPGLLHHAGHRAPLSLPSPGAPGTTMPPHPPPRSLPFSAPRSRSCSHRSLPFSGAPDMAIPPHRAPAILRGTGHRAPGTVVPPLDPRHLSGYRRRDPTFAFCACPRRSQMLGAVAVPRAPASAGEGCTPRWPTADRGIPGDSPWVLFLAAGEVMEHRGWGPGMPQKVPNQETPTVTLAPRPHPAWDVSPVPESSHPQQPEPGGGHPGGADCCGEVSDATRGTRCHCGGLLQGGDIKSPSLIGLRLLGGSILAVPRVPQCPPPPVVCGMRLSP